MSLCILGGMHSNLENIPGKGTYWGRPASPAARAREMPRPLGARASRAKVFSAIAKLLSRRYEGQKL